MRWSSNEGSLCSLLVQLQLATDESQRLGRRVSADMVICKASLQHQTSDVVSLREKILQFLSLVLFIYLFIFVIYCQNSLSLNP